MPFEYDSSGYDTGRQTTGDDGILYKEVRHVVKQFEVDRDDQGGELSRQFVEDVHCALHWEPVAQDPTWKQPPCYDSGFWRRLLE